MTSRALIGDLTAVGFSEHEAKAYIALYALGQATAYEMAKEGGLPNSNAYNVIRALAAKHAVRKVADRPSRYVAVPPEELLRSLSERVASACSSIVAQFEALKPKQAVSFVDIIVDEHEIVQRLISTIGSARRQLLLKGDGALPTPIVDALLDAASRGVQCLFIHYGAAPSAFSADNIFCWSHEGNGVRLGMGDDYLTLCSDEVSALIYRLTPHPEGAYSENKSFVYMTSVMLRHEIYLAEIMTKLGDEIASNFGPGLYDIRKRFNAIDPKSTFKKYVEEQREGNY